MEIMIFLLAYKEKIVKLNVTTFIVKETISNEWEFVEIGCALILTWKLNETRMLKR